MWDKDSFGRITFDDRSMGYSHLGHIVENAGVSTTRCGQKPSAVLRRHAHGTR
ncbi:hypothetical protein ACLK1Y_16120 [Escherichia coli]